MAAAVGRLGWAPATVQASAPATLARWSAAARSAPPSRAAASTPTKASPAAVVSTASTASAPMRQAPSPKAMAPSAPRVTTVSSRHWSESPRAAAIGSSAARPAASASIAASISFMTRTSMFSRALAGIGAAGALLSTTRAPAARARAAACQVSSRSTSSWRSRVVSGPSRPAGTWSARVVAVGAARHRDLVATLGIDADHGEAGRSLRLAHRREIDSRLAQGGERQGREAVGPDAAGHRHPCPGARRRDCLIGPLAAGDGHVIGRQNGLARARQRRHPGDEIHVDRAEDDNHGRFRRSARSRHRMARAAPS